MSLRKVISGTVAIVLVTCDTALVASDTVMAPSCRNLAAETVKQLATRAVAAPDRAEYRD
jgi:hypothetical protein